jgi:hypothetical protein
MLLVAGGFFLEQSPAYAWADEAKMILSDPELAKLIEDSAKMLQSATKSQSEFNRLAKTVEAEGYNLVLIAQAAMGNPSLADKAPGLRDAALSLAEAAKKKDYTEVKKQVTAVAGFKSMSGGGKTSATPLAKAVPLKNLMASVRDTDTVLKGATRLTAAQWMQRGKAEEIAAHAMKMTTLTLGMLAHAPEKDPDPKKGQTRQLWIESSEEVQGFTLEMAKAVRAKNPTEYKKVYMKMDAACTKCHDKYRVEAD